MIFWNFEEKKTQRTEKVTIMFASTHVLRRFCRTSGDMIYQDEKHNPNV